MRRPLTKKTKTTKEEHRKQWVKLLHSGWMFHQQMVKDTHNEIIGSEPSDENLYHKALSVANMDAMELIQEIEVLGYFDEVDEELSKPGPAG